MVNETWQQSQKWLATLSSNSECIVVPNASHAIMYDDPKVIVTSVVNMFEKLKNKRKDRGFEESFNPCLAFSSAVYDS